MSVKIHAPAKINLTLDVIDRRTDGYHIIESVMQTVDVCDEITLTACDDEGIFLTCSDEALPTDAKNTAYRAAEVFYRHVNQVPHVRIHVEKKIPTQAGMGGESADAAGVLRGLNILENAGFSTEELCRMGGEIGADVPFCVLQGTALSEGIGSILTPVAVLPDCPIVIAKGEKGVSTVEAYTAIDRAETRGHYPAAPLIEALCAEDLEVIAANIGNVFDEVLQLPDVVRIKEIMRENGTMGCSMTGSGSAVFGLFEDKRTASVCVEALEDIGFTAFVCHPYRAEDEAE